MIAHTPTSRLDDYLGHAVRGERYPAVQLAIELLDTGVRFEDVIDDLLAIAQREVGERWFRNVLTVADEHVASGIAAAALAADISDSEGVGHTVVVCAEGEWHWLAAQMLGEGLRSAGERVTVLGGSTPLTGTGSRSSPVGVPSARRLIGPSGSAPTRGLPPPRTRRGSSSGGASIPLMQLRHRPRSILWA